MEPVLIEDLDPAEEPPAVDRRDGGGDQRTDDQAADQAHDRSGGPSEEGLSGGGA